jgi:hypothetical protein
MKVKDGAGEEERDKDKGGRDKEKVKEYDGVRGNYEETIELYIYITMEETDRENMTG